MESYKAVIGDTAYELGIGTNTATIDGTTVDWSTAKVHDGDMSLIVDGRSVAAGFEAGAKPGEVLVTIGHRQYKVLVKDSKALLLEKYGIDSGSNAAETELRAPMPGLVLKIMVEAGQQVAEGDGLMVLEAMKMENEIRASSATTIKAIHVAPGDAVGKNDLLIEYDA